MKKLQRYILVFSISFALLLIAPAFLGGQFPIYPLMSWGDVLDILTPMILLPLYWILFWFGSSEKIKLGESLVFVFLAGMWAEGQGMHLSANSIGHLLDETVHGDIYLLTGFYDEKVSHYLWHLGIFGLTALLIYRSWRSPSGNTQISWGMVIPAGIIHGLTIFMIVIEGGTVLIGIPFALLVPLVILVCCRDRLRTQPLISFYFISCLVALLFLAGWCTYWCGCPEPSKVGII